MESRLEEGTEKANKLKQYLVPTVLLLSTILSFIFFEGWMVSLTLLVGFLLASLIIGVILLALCLGVVFLYEYGQRGGEYRLVTKLRSKLSKKENEIKPWTRNLIRKSLPLGFFVSTEVFGPLITIVIVQATTSMGKKRLIVAATLSSFLFSFSWVAIYSLAIYGVKKLI